MFIEENPPPAPRLDHGKLEEASVSVADIFAILWEHLNEWVSGHTLADGTWKPAINDSPKANKREHWRGRGCVEFSLIADALRMPDSERLPAEVLQYLLDDDPSSHYLPALGRCDASGPDRAFVVALAIDEALQEIHPALHDEYDGLTPGLQKLSRRLVEEGRYNLNPALWLVFPTAPGTAQERNSADYDAHRTGLAWRSKSIAAHFRYIGCVPPHRQPSYSIRLLQLAQRDGVLLPTDRLPRVAIVPLAESPEDIRVVVQEGEEKSYRVEVDDEPRNPRRARLAERARQSIHEVARLGYEIVLFPELVVTPEISKVIQEALRQAARDLSLHARPTHLRLAIAGSGLNDSHENRAPYNECHVYSGFGKPLWKQQKHNHFQMDSEHIDALSAVDAYADAAKAASLHALNGEEPSPKGRYCEHMTSGRTFVVADCASARMVVTICEDFSHSYLADHLGAALRPDWVFVPVMDTELAPPRWTRVQASHWGKHGCSSIVANSAVLPQVDPYPKDKTPPCDVVIGMIAGPAWGDLYFSVHLPNSDPTLPLLALTPRRWGT